MSLANLYLSRDLILVKLPAYTDHLTRDAGVLSINTLNEVKYNPTSGTVVGVAKGVKLDIGDTVFFEKNHWNAAKENRYDSEAERDKGIYFGNEVYGIKEGDDNYMILPFGFLYMSEPKDGGVRMLNGYALCEPVEKTRPSAKLNIASMSDTQITEMINCLKQTGVLLEIADLREETYALNEVNVLVVPEGTPPDTYGGKVVVGYLDDLCNSPNFLQKGDTAYTLKHCDIPLVEPLNGSETAFIIQLEDIIAKYDTNMKTYVASPNRIIIEVQEQEQDPEALQIDSQFAKMSFGKVISAGTGVECKPGDTIVFPRNAGQKGKLPIPPGGVQLEVINKEDYFAVVNE